MSVRLLSQWAAYALSIIILITSFAGIYKRYALRHLLLIGIAYGLTGTVFYTIVLVLQRGATFGNEFSSVRTLIKDALMAWMIFFVLTNDVTIRLNRIKDKWKKS